MAWLDLVDMLGGEEGESPKSSVQVTYLSVMGTPGLPLATEFDPSLPLIGHGHLFLRDIGRLMNP